ncbi:MULTISPECIES: heme ABC transporter substrate-binding protein IsdE [Lysinibacillus]|jgi:iron complex transport system substrate-binding protein|uniref:High-affinity heme uptake system protein IsdE n=1 Tax=Lysinibacillus fusiformis TaxID=28031 RepID=A0A2I0V5M3_9BACI|nr:MULTISPECIES: heme ABC transporter substrate-binding protein IsdE [Lysinibacillus]KUF33872.1 heme ABC transporter substrate-binding protein IsdE [Lysinibacillus sp. F5]MEE3807422.1 heme ABC transporter substrate-binding protein IsdE [Lysinibacillus fusiformis]PKU53522.1 heme ABC transporter substrate-binding protein IsdE [Lysinibacillus fusiformis]SCX76031.1 iron complex transport system substrate-binding protein [Lysinibacillus sp. SG9]SDB01987.1 iron complex transport system substrate-bin
MKKDWKIGILLMTLLSLLLAACSGSDKPATKDKTVAVSEQVAEESEQRIIAGTVVVADILDKLELDAIAVPETEKQLAKRFEDLPTIGNAMEPDMEIVKSLNPTEVLSVSTLEYDLQDKFKQLNIPVDFLNLQSVDAMLTEITTLGERYDRVAQAEELVQDLQKNMEAVQGVAANKEGPRVLILLGIPGSYLVATENSYAGDLVKRAGGINVMEGQDAEYLSSNTEHLHSSNPDIILRLSHGMPDEVVKMFDEEFKTNDIWKHFDAVKNGKVYDLEEELFGTTASLQVPQALGQLMEIFYRK